jgi:hypothetical protein
MERSQERSREGVLIIIIFFKKEVENMATSADWGTNWGGWYPTATDFWWGCPTGWTDLDLYDYNRNFVLDDNEIEDLVKDNIAANPAITVSDRNRIDVKVKDGVVTLTGKVKNPRTKPLAYADAYWSSGVVDVNNKLEVTPMRRREEQGESQSRLK